MNNSNLNITVENNESTLDLGVDISIKDISIDLYIGGDGGSFASAGDMTVDPSTGEIVISDVHLSTYSTFSMDAENAETSLLALSSEFDGEWNNIVATYATKEELAEVVISGGGIALGETSATAYRGDRGKIAYDHSQVAHAPSNAEQNVNADWNAISGDAQILNKPAIPSISGLATESYVQSYSEPIISTKLTAFNKNFGTTAGTVLEGRTFGSAANSNTTDFAQALGSTDNYVTDEEKDALWHRFTGSCVIPEITDNGNGSVTIGAGSFCTNRTSDGKGIIDQHEYDGGLLNLTDGVMNYIVGDYNAGVPSVRVTTNVAEINETTIVPIYSVFRYGNFLHTQHWDSLAAALANKIHRSIVKTQRYRRQEGLSLSEFGTRNLALTAGVVFVGAVEYVLNSIDSTADSIFQYTQNALGAWELNLVTQYNNTQYNTPTGVVVLTNNRYAVNWIFRGVENQKHLYSVLGVGDYTLTQAQESGLPSIPINISSHAVLVAKVIIQKSAATATSIRSAFDTTISFSPITEHNNTTGLQGGVAGEYYHMTAAEKTSYDNTLTAVGALNNITEIAASGIAATYPLEPNKQVSIMGTLPNGVSSTLTLPTPTSAKENESVVHFASNATATPTLVYSGFTPIWGGGKALAMVASKRYTIVFEQIYNGTAWVVLSNWREY